MPQGDWNWHVITPSGVDLLALPVERVIIRSAATAPGQFRWHALVLDRVPIRSSPLFATRDLARIDAEATYPGVNVVLDPGPD
jgi:hypothetical protein